MFAAGMPWNLITTAVGLAGIVAGLMQMKNSGKNYAGLIIGLTAVTFLLGVTAYGLGLWDAVSTTDLDKDPTKAAALMGVAQGYAATALAWGALMSALVGGMAVHKAQS
jgi:hypothetical protein